MSLPGTARQRPEDDWLMTDKVAIVTGAGSRADGIGNGRAAAILLARRGARVLLIDSVREWAELTHTLISGEGGESQVRVCDVTDDSACAAAVETAAKRWGRLDIMVNNVGISGATGNAVEVDLEGWETGLRTNVTSMMYMVRHSVPLMRRQNQGAIVNVASVAGLLGGHASLVYPTSKGAVVNMTRAMAAQHGREGIRVNCVAPGMVYTPMAYAKGMTEERRQARIKRSLLQTEGTGWDVGHTITFLASDAARWITGVVLPVDAGATAGRLDGQ